MGTGSAGTSATMAFRGTTPVTSEVVTGAVVETGAAGGGSFAPQAVQHHNDTRNAAIRLGMNFEW